MPHHAVMPPFPLRTFMSGQITGTSTPFTTSTILHISKLNVERDLPILQRTFTTVWIPRPHSTSLKTCLQQVISYLCRTRQRLPHCITDPLVRYEHTRPKTSSYRHCEQNTSTLFEKTLIQLTYRTMQPRHTWVWRRNYTDGNWVMFREISG